MTRMRIFVAAGTALALAALGWCLSDAHGGFDRVSAALLSRSAGLVLLGLALVAAGLIFRAATMVPRTVRTAPAARRTSEFRRGFGHKPQQRHARERDIIVALRRAAAHRASETGASTPSDASLPPEQLARLRTLVGDRAARLRSRDAEIAKRQFLRSGIDGHGVTGHERPRS